ncbi:MAG: 50S ribosomal protein L25 [Endomicrobium sp.]|jgi:large subunit ribosomal protein L25|nr:50S ribosomal protein L25 [Endomicrobium sp.]
MKEVILDVQTREVGAKSKLSTLRKKEKIPAVFYGKNIKPESITVDAKSFMSIIEKNGANVIVDLNFKSGKKPAIVKSLQRDVLMQNPIHIDFQSISLEDKVEVLVPIHVEGVADGVKNFGGVMEFIVREVKVKALPKSIPQMIAVDVSSLGLGQGLTIADLPKTEGLEYIQDPTTLIVNVIAVAAEEEKPKEESTETAQPEVISKGKKDKEEGAEASSTSGVKKVNI